MYEGEDENEIVEENVHTEGELMQKVDLAYLIGVPIDVPYKYQEQYFPFLSKIMHLGNFKQNDILDMLDDFEIVKLEGLRRKRRYEIKDSYNRQEHVRMRAYANAALSLSREGFAVKRLTAIHKHITYEDEQKRVGGFGFGIFRRGGND